MEHTDKGGKIIVASNNGDALKAIRVIFALLVLTIAPEMTGTEAPAQQLDRPPEPSEVNYYPSDYFKGFSDPSGFPQLRSKIPLGRPSPPCIRAGL